MNTRKARQVLKTIRAEMEVHVKHTDYRLNDETLAGMCGVCSYIVFVAFKKMGYKPTFHMNDIHCFVTVDGYWADVTLRQFADSAPRVYLRRTPYSSVHDSDESAKSIKKIRRMFRGWSNDQNPFRRKLPTIQPA